MNQVILMTGASSGIGLATAKKLLGEGYTVYASARKKEAADEIEKLGGTALQIELTDEQSMKDAVDRVVKEHGRIDILFNHAGYGHYGVVEELNVDVGRHTMEVNLFGHARLTQLVLPHMRKQGSGKILMTSSIGGKVYFPLGSWYHASKHAIEGWSDCLRLELAPLGIKVIIIEPGIIDTGFNELMIDRIKEGKDIKAYDTIKGAMLSRNERETDDRGSQPVVIANLVSKALNAKNPKPRYHAGRIAGPILFARWLLTDRLFDKMIMGFIRQRTK